MKVLSLFSGIGAFEVALDEENIDWELDHYCEIDKYASQSYNMIHGTKDSDNLKNVACIDYSGIGSIDLLTYGFPCQDISTAGKCKGFFSEDGSVTRSGLFFSAADAIQHTKPKFAIFENVKNLTSNKFKSEFETVLQTLDELGYNTYCKVMNAKDYGVPQNRERVFGISIRKDIDRGYTFPRGFDLAIRLKDILEENVDDKYYLSEDKINKISTSNFNQEKDMIQEGDICSTLLARDYKDPKCIRIIEPYVYPCMNKKGYKLAYDGDGIVTSRPHQARSTVISQCSFAIRAQNAADSGVCLLEQNKYRVRKLTPRECWRLMGFRDAYFDRVKGVSNTQLYKQAGNSIVVDVLRHIFREFKTQYPEYFKTNKGE